MFKLKPLNYGKDVYRQLISMELMQCCLKRFAINVAKEVMYVDILHPSGLPYWLVPVHTNCAIPVSNGYAVYQMSVH